MKHRIPFFITVQFCSSMKRDIIGSALNQRHVQSGAAALENNKPYYLCTIRLDVYQMPQILTHNTQSALKTIKGNELFSIDGIPNNIGSSFIFWEPTGLSYIIPIDLYMHVTSLVRLQDKLLKSQFGYFFSQFLWLVRSPASPLLYRISHQNVK